MPDFQFATEFEIAGRKVGGDASCFIIAEAGVSHFGDLNKAYQLVDMAKEAEADAVKFQIFKTDELISEASEEWKDRLRSKELVYEDFIKIADYCSEQGITFLATAHDEPSLEFLESLNVPAYKIGSGEIQNWPFIEMIAATQKPVILSTGMYREEDIENALTVFAKVGNPNLAVLHCVTSYPTPPSAVNLKAISFLKKRFNVISGFSDHTEGYHIPLAAAALGAQVIEKHISMDFNVPNAQDWKVSCGPHNLARFISEIRDVEQALGVESKNVEACEEQSIEWARKSITAARDIDAGSIISREDLVFKRPGTGLPPSEIDQVLGRKTVKSIKADTIISKDMIDG